jgi:fluoride exporter
MTWVLVGLGAGAGALARWELGGWVQARNSPAWPWGTLVVNLVGSFATGALAEAGVSGRWATLAGAGFLGGFTTFSTWMVETVRLAQEPGPFARRAVVNLLGMLGLGLVMVALGHAVVA